LFAPQQQSSLPGPPSSTIGNRQLLEELIQSKAKFLGGGHASWLIPSLVQVKSACASRNPEIQPSTDLPIQPRRAAPFALSNSQTVQVAAKPSTTFLGIPSSMIMAQPRDQYAGPPRPLFPSDSVERPTIQLPSLPSMSSLLAGSEPQRHPMESEQRQVAYHQRPFPSHLNHPLQFSETNPSAPLHHLYHPPQPNCASYQPPPVLIPASDSLSPTQYEPPVAQQRQSKIISQRRDFFPKENEQLNRFPAQLESPVQRHSPQHQRPYEPDRAQYSPQSMVSPSQITPRDMTQSKSIPISNLLSTSSR